MVKLSKCLKCNKICNGEVLKLDNKFYHKLCFKCSDSNFCTRDGVVYCEDHFNEKYGIRCHRCKSFMAGKVMSAQNKFYHPQCFTCSVCNVPLNPGKIYETVGNLCCPKCVHIELASTTTQSKLDQRPIINGQISEEPNNSELASGATQNVKEIICESCHKEISGQLLQAGDKFFHPECGKCVICNKTFVEAEDVYLLGTDIWHFYCAYPENMSVVDQSHGHHSMNTSLFSRGSTSYSSLDRTRNSLGENLLYPYVPSFINKRMLRDSSSNTTAQAPQAYSPLPQLYTISYLNPGLTNQGYLKTTLPVKMPKSPHFHRPLGPNFSYRHPRNHLMNVTISAIAAKRKGGRAGAISQLSSSRCSDSVLLPQEMINNDTTTPTNMIPVSQSITAAKIEADIEPIELAHFPDARKPKDEDILTPKIEREDWPAPPFGPAMPERKYLWARPQDAKDDEDMNGEEKPPLTKEVEYLRNIHSGLGNVLLKEFSNQQFLAGKVMKNPQYSSRTSSACDTHVTFPDLKYQSDMEPPEANLNTTSANHYEANEIRSRSVELGDRYSRMDLQNDQNGQRQKYKYEGAIPNEMYCIYPHTAYHTRSMPNMADVESLKIYPYHLIKTTNRKLPPGICRTRLESHLAPHEFMYIFGCTMEEFYTLPEWRRNLLKKAAKLW